MTGLEPFTLAPSRSCREKIYYPSKFSFNLIMKNSNQHIIENARYLTLSSRLVTRKQDTALPNFTSDMKTLLQDSKVSP